MIRLAVLLLAALPAAAAPVPKELTSDEPDAAAVAAWQARGVKFEWHGYDPLGQEKWQPARKGLADAVLIVRLDKFDWAGPPLPPLGVPHRLFIWDQEPPAGWAGRLPDRGAVVGFNFTGIKNEGPEIEEVLAFPNVAFLRLQSMAVPPGLVGRLAALKKLTSLGLYNARMAKGELKNLAKLATLEELDLSQLRITDADLAVLDGLDKLRDLDLNGSRVTDAGMETVAGVRGLRSLTVCNTRVGDDGLKALAGLKELRRLELRSTNVGDGGMAHLGAIPSLRSLQLPSRISDAGVAALKPLAGLEHLDLGTATVGDDGAAALAGFRRLRTLNATDAKMTPATQDAIRKALPLTRVRLPGKVEAVGGGVMG